MKLDGIHHVTCITGDALANVDFYARVLGLRLVKKTVNQDDPTVYHLFYADERGSPGSDITFFEYRGARRGRAGAGMVHTIVFRVGSEDALDFWEQRLAGERVAAIRHDGKLSVADPEGLQLELAAVDRGQEPLVAEHPDIPRELAIQGFDGVRAFSSEPAASRPFLEQSMRFEAEREDAWIARGDHRSGFYVYDRPPPDRGSGGAGTVHHVAWASTMEEHEAWRRRVAEGGANVTPVIDRFWFHSIYFREPSGVLFEIATLGPGFAVDEDPQHLGETLVLPPAFEHLRSEVERTLTPIPSLR
jgi:glyoxalase family protein